MDRENISVRSGEILGVVTNERIPLPIGAECVDLYDVTIESLSVSENLFVGQMRDFERFFAVDRGRLYRSTKVILNRYGMCCVSPDAMLSELSPGERKILEICRAIEKAPSTLVLYNVFCTLNGRWRGVATRIIKKYASAGGRVLFVSRDGEEVREISDRAINLQEARGILQRNGGEPSCEVILRGINLYRKGLYNVNIKLHRGEILGIVGLYHGGLHILGEVLCGKKPLERGRIYVKGKRIKGFCGAKKRKIVYLRGEHGCDKILKILSGGCDVIIADNILLGAKSGDVRKICDALEEKCRRGAGVVFISEDVDEQINMSNRIILLSCGAFVGELERGAGYNRQEILNAILSEGYVEKGKVT